MQWNPSREEISIKDEFPQYDSGLDKENVDPDVTLYESSSHPTRSLTEHDSNTRDSGYESGKFYQFAKSLGVTPQTAWQGKRAFGSLDSFEEEFMDLESVNVANLPTDFNTLISGKLTSPNTRPLKRAKPDQPSDESIKSAIQRSATEPDLIGDFSKMYCLPLTPGRHQDLKSISSSTLAKLLQGNYTALDAYKIIDCRFPYEFEGGHVQGAVNLYTKDQVMNLLNEEVPGGKRQALIFHCEFSSERGPGLCRFLRNLDRIRNKDAYPALNYPELYVLDGGYKKFYEEFGELCLPQAYKPMLHPEHQFDLRYFKGKSKSATESRVQLSNRGKFKRLGFL